MIYDDLRLSSKLPGSQWMLPHLWHQRIARHGSGERPCAPWPAELEVWSHWWTKTVVSHKCATNLLVSLDNFVNLPWISEGKKYHAADRHRRPGMCVNLLTCSWSLTGSWRSLLESVQDEGKNMEPSNVQASTNHEAPNLTTETSWLWSTLFVWYLYQECDASRFWNKGPGNHLETTVVPYLWLWGNPYGFRNRLVQAKSMHCISHHGFATLFTR